MAKGISIHIGLNHVDPNAYGGWDGELFGCINDARSMESIASDMGYESITTLIDEEATSARVIEEIARAAQSLTSGDILLLSYSGHGGQVEDVNFDEDDGQDETWVLYDRMLIDDELYSLWGQFESGVRIFMLSDSCHSGTVAKMMAYRNIYSLPSKAKDLAGANGQPPAFKAIPREVQSRAYRENQTLYNMLQWAAGRGDRSTLAASVLLISGCQDNQLSADGDGNGLFTANVLEAWDNGSFAGNYEQFWKEILRRMPVEQSPNYFKVGAVNLEFESQRPFTIAAMGDDSAGGDATSLLPSVHPPQHWSYESEIGPTCRVVTGANRLYVLEAFTEPQLADITNHGAERRGDNFYATWNDPNLPARLTASNFQLPDYAWNQMKKPGGRIYFRIGTTSSMTAWDNYTVSTGDLQGDQAPYLEVSSETVPSPTPTPGAGYVKYPSGEEFEVVSLADVDDGIDYSDPTANEKVPLIRITGRTDDRVATNFLMRELVDDKNSGYARISPDLVEKLQRIRDQAGRIDIRSGYRHPDLNASVGGSSRSRHMSGEAVEISSQTLSALELAEIALEEMGCEIGIGLGPNYIGVDVRGSLATWVEPGAHMSASDFRAWVNQTCMRSVQPDAARVLAGQKYG